MYLLIDAVESSKFITAAKSKDLIEKLSSSTSDHVATNLKRNVLCDGRIKPANEQIYYIVDVLNDAINQGKSIVSVFSVQCKKEQRLHLDGEVYTFSPYTLVWNGDYCYVAGFSDKHQNIGSFRVDRIYKPPKILREDAVPRPEGFDEASYIRTMFRMYNKGPQTVELICDNDLMDMMIDKFGIDVKTYAYSLSAFKAEVKVAVSHVLYSFGSKVRIKGPESVKELYRDMVIQAAELI